MTLRVAALPSDSGACGHYRVLQPLRTLERRGDIDLRLEQIPDGRFKISNTMMRECDVTILQKPGGALTPGNPVEEAFFGDVLQNGWRIVYEVDDDLERVTRENPVIHPSKWPGYVDRTRRLMSCCRLITTTTHYAAANLVRRHKMPVRVVPNGVDLDLWRPAGWQPRAPSRIVRIAWAASRNHVEDARLLIGPFREIAAKHPEVRFILAGADWPAIREAVGFACEYVGGVDRMEDWPAFARSLDADIWVAPLVDSVFARSKSNLKFLEGTAVGAAVVASNVEPYRNGPDGTPWFVPPLGLATSTRDWVICLSTLIEHPEYRHQLWEKADRALREHYTAQCGADALLTVLREVAGQEEPCKISRTI